MIPGLAIFDLIGKVLDRVIPDKAAAEKAKLDMLTLAQQQEFQQAIKQAEINLAEAQNPRVFVSGWRPFIGWVCGVSLGYTFLGYPLLLWVQATWFPEIAPPNLGSENLMELTLAMLGIAGIRMYEKVKGVASK